MDVSISAKELRIAEEAIFDCLEHDPADQTFLGRLYRDGVPTPETYLGQRVRILFVFREPNMRGDAHAHDMREEVRDLRFRPVGPDGAREERSPKGWWNGKAGMFAHAVAAALQGEGWDAAFRRFEQGGWNHDVVNRFGYIQIKKLGGGGTANPDEICAHAEKYSGALLKQLDLYRPHMVLGCGVGRDSPARLLATHVLPGGRASVTKRTGATWWQFSPGTFPQAMVQLWHPARRGERSELYEDVWSSVGEVLEGTGLRSQ